MRSFVHVGFLTEENRALIAHIYVLPHCRYSAVAKQNTDVKRAPVPVPVPVPVAACNP